MTKAVEVSTRKRDVNKAMKGRLLIADDEAIIRKSLQRLLEAEGHEVVTVENGLEALEALRDGKFDVLITDVNMPNLDGERLMLEVRRQHTDTDVIVITGYGTVESAVTAIRDGAFDYIVKPVEDEKIKSTIRRSLESRELRAENESLKRTLNFRTNYKNIIGRDQSMRKIFDIIEAVADTRATVLITGESGTGKTMLARAIHFNSNRHQKPFVEVNCGALPENLLESELFGHTKGSFTGAIKDKVGKFQQAHLGTIFLDEISTATHSLQIKLLRVLQDRVLERVGSNETVEVDVRVILATNSELSAEVKKGNFREDLFYRINVVSIEIPPLRERSNDIPHLAEFFLDYYNRENGKSLAGIHEDAMAKLVAHPWPGNVRELENAIERAVVLTKNDRVLPDDLPKIVVHSDIDDVEPELESDEVMPLKQALEGPEKRIIERALKLNKWNRQKTAQMLDVNRTTLFNKMKKYGLLAD
ncbi:MAG: sigma-54 dependent transcriptional regulator [Planctomycetota bacterium]